MTFSIKTDDGTICRLSIVERESDEPGGKHTAELKSHGFIGSRETIVHLLERIHRLYPKSEFAMPAGKGVA